MLPPKPLQKKNLKYLYVQNTGTQFFFVLEMKDLLSSLF